MIGGSILMHLPFTRSRLLVLVVIGLLGCLPMSAAPGQPSSPSSTTPSTNASTTDASTPRLVAPRLTDAPIIDGDLSDPIWHSAAVVDGLIVAGSYAPADQKTSIRLAFTNDALFVAFDCDDTAVIATTRDHDQAAWDDDCVEIFLSPRFRLDEYIHFIVGANGATYDERNGNASWSSQPAMQSAVKRRPGGYTVEIALPFAGILNDASLQPRRGDLWGLKLTRSDRDQQRGAPLQNSSWTPIAQAFADASAWGDLVFENTNVLANGSFENDDNNDGIPDGWIFYVTDQYDKNPDCIAIDNAVRTDGQRSCRVDINTNYIVINPADFNPRDGRSYHVTARMRLDTNTNPDTNTDHRRTYARMAVIPNQNQTDITAPTHSQFIQRTLMLNHHRRDHATLAFGMGGRGTLWIDDVQINMVRQVIEPGLVCLTGNATGSLADRNIELPGATYTYRETLTDAPFFPYPDPDNSENGQTAGDVPFTTGILTNANARDTVAWPCYWLGRHGVAVQIDLPDDYIIRKVEIYSATNSLTDVQLFTRAMHAERYTRTAMTAHPNHDPPVRGYVFFDDLNIPANRLRLNARLLQTVTYPALSEIIVWGTPANATVTATTPSPTPATIPGLTPTEPRDIPVPAAPDLSILPVPHERQTRSATFALTADTTIICRNDDPRSLTTAQILRDEIRNDTGLELTIISPSSSSSSNAAPTAVHPPAPATPPIVIDADGLDIPEHEQGYAIRISDDRIALAGRSPRATFYACMTLLQMIATRNDNWIVNHADIRDWPDYPYRYVQSGLDLFPADRGRNLLRAMARFKINYLSVGMQNAPIEHARALADIADRYFINLMPSCDFRSGSMLSYDHGALVERAADEPLESLGRGRRNICPSNPESWKQWEAQVDRIVTGFNSDLVGINLDEMYQPANGSRWNVCPLCRQRNMHGYELIADMINRCQAILAKHGKRALIIDSPLYSRGITNEHDTNDDWRNAQDLIDKQVAIYDWHGKITKHMTERGHTVLRWGIVPSANALRDGMQGWLLVSADGPFNPQHVLDMSRLMWNTDATRNKSPENDARLSHAMRQWNNIVTGVVSPVGRPGDKSFQTIDLTSVANRDLTDTTPGDGRGWIDDGPQRDMQAITPGPHTLAGIPFTIAKRAVMIHNPFYFNRELPQRVTIPVNQHAASLVFLHTLDRTAGHNYERRDELAGFYYMIYDDDSAAPLEIKYNRNITNWDKFRDYGYAVTSDVLPDAMLAWQGLTAGGENISLYATEWVNPYPDRRIDRILFATPYRAQPFNPILLAVTAVESKPVDRLTWRDIDTPLIHIDDIAPQKPTGRPLDFTGGTTPDDATYRAPDATLFSFGTVMPEHATRGCETYPNRAETIIEPGNYGVRNYSTVSLTITFPQPRQLTCVGLFASPRDEHYLNDFRPANVDYQIQTADGHTIAHQQNYISERDGWRYHTFEPRMIKSLTISVDANQYVASGASSYRRGIAGIRLYTPE